MKSSGKYTNWLRSKISALNPYIIYSFVFGSVARHSPNPNDCDLMIVTSTSPGTKEWDSVRNKKDNLCKLFNSEFDLNLSAILLTIDEYIENIPFLKRILKRPLIEIHGHSIKTPNKSLENRRENAGAFPASQLQHSARKSWSIFTTDNEGRARNDK